MSFRARRPRIGQADAMHVIIVGAGNLGSAITKYGGFAAWGFEIVAVVDVDDVKIGSPIDGLTIEPFDSVRIIVPERDVQIGVIATPPDAAQQAADELMAAGIRSILNLAPVILKTRDDVIVRRIDLSTELGILAYHLSSASTGEAS